VEAVGKAGRPGLAVAAVAVAAGLVDQWAGVEFQPFEANRHLTALARLVRSCKTNTCSHLRWAA